MKHKCYAHTTYSEHSYVWTMLRIDAYIHEREYIFLSGHPVMEICDTITRNIIVPHIRNPSSFLWCFFQAYFVS